MAWTAQQYNSAITADRKALTVCKQAGMTLICPVNDAGAKGVFCASGLTFFVIQYVPTNDLVLLSNADALTLLFQLAALIP